MMSFSKFLKKQAKAPRENPIPKSTTNYKKKIKSNVPQIISLVDITIYKN